MNIEELLIFYEKNKRPILIWSSFVFVLFVLLISVIVFVYKFVPQPTRNTGDGNNTSLPGDLNIDKVEDDLEAKLNGIKAEDIMFGHLYKEIENDFIPNVKDYPLPFDIKVSAENYYDVSRKIDLSKYVEDLNKNGFKVIDNPYTDADDFYSVYKKLLENDVPIIITNDFMMYYNQNNLKNVFDEIKKSTFYKNVWDIYKELYEKALARYNERLLRLGVSNDPVLEGQRLETAYLAMVLKLLSPTIDQISQQKSLTGNNKFTKAEAEYFDISLPEHLSKDVEKELALIRKAKVSEKSPILLYARDYTSFAVPRQYSDDAKIYNFYLATKWLTSVFPLYFSSDDCPDCLLDKNDWLINLASASYLAKDLSDSQKNKNRWAIIYKFISYFSGLRQDLTYLHYNRAMENIYGKGYVIENIFARENFNDVDTFKIQEEIAKNKFSEIEGSYDRSVKNPKIGMRMLQEPYWPNDYIFKKLSGKNMTVKTKSVARLKQTTLCGNYRCNGTAMDVINIGAPISNSAKFANETNYELYDNEMEKLRNYMNGFNVYTWNTNIYWSTLDVVYAMLKEDRSHFPFFMKSDEWLNNREINTALGIWTNIHLPKDTYRSSAVEGDNASMRPICDLPNFVEPKMDSIYETIAKNKMIMEMMDVLNVNRDSSVAALDIQDANSKLEHLIDIEKKILSGKLMNFSDCSYIESIVNNRILNEQGSKSFKIGDGISTVTESINGVKLLVAVFTHGEDNIIAVGPVFDYAETVKRR